MQYTNPYSARDNGHVLYNVGQRSNIGHKDSVLVDVPINNICQKADWQNVKKF